jgi:hypothetical protein
VFLEHLSGLTQEAFSLAMGPIPVNLPNNHLSDFGIEVVTHVAQHARFSDEDEVGDRSRLLGTIQKPGDAMVEAVAGLFVRRDFATRDRARTR